MRFKSQFVRNRMKLPKSLASVLKNKIIHYAVTIYSSTGYNECRINKGFWTTNKKFVTCKRCLVKIRKNKA